MSLHNFHLIKATTSYLELLLFSILIAIHLAVVNFKTRQKETGQIDAFSMNTRSVSSVYQMQECIEMPTLSCRQFLKRDLVHFMGSFLC